MALKWLENLLTPKVEVKIVEKVIVEKPESCPKDSVCAFEYRGKLYRSKEEIDKVKERELKQEEDRRMSKLARKLNNSFERRNRIYHCEPVFSHHRKEAIQYMLENHKEIGEMIREAKGLPKYVRTGRDEYKAVY